MQNPGFSLDLIQEGQALVDQDKVGEVLFSGGTYQVEIKGDEEAFWPFLQLTDQGVLKDSFCSCESVGLCAHQAAAWVKMFRGGETPLHVRFKESFLAAVCRLAARRHGAEMVLVKKGEGLEILSTTKKRLFSVEPHTQAGREIMHLLTQTKAPETEETSLKFSNLSLEEIQLWKEGRPSPELSFELSVWADLAKVCFLSLEEGKAYTIDFGEMQVLPRGVEIKFSDLSLFFYIAEVDWQEIIPTLNTVNAPLQVHALSQKQIKRLFYDVLRQVFHLDIDMGPEVERGSCPRVGDWVYVPQHGFYPSQIDPLLKEKLIPAEHIGKFLQRHHALLKHHLQGTKIHDGVWPARYHLFFDEARALHLVAYLFEKGDLQVPYAAQFGSWVFIPTKGFFLLADALFETVETVIPQREVSQFVSRHKHWLHAYEGFQTHVVAIGSRLGYRVSDEGLEFTAQFDLVETTDDVLDFHEWLYVRGRGFYAKDTASNQTFLKGGLKIARPEVNGFIWGHQEALETVSGFFSTASPLAASGIKVHLTEEGRVAVQPVYTFYPAYVERKPELFDDYTYVHGDGFCEIPSHLKLPSPYCKPHLIDQEEEPHFIAYLIDTLKPYVMEIDPKLKKPEYLQLQMRSLQQEEGGMWVVQLFYQTDLGTLPAHTVWQALVEDKKHLFSPAGLLLLNVPRYNWLKMIPKKRWLKQGQFLKLTTLEWVRLFAFEQLTPPEDEAGQAVWKQFQSMQAKEVPQLTGFLSQLRPYQESGLHWLWFLYSYSLSGLLCDEMGLGKTHQAMALLAAVSAGNAQAKFVVVCPTSVIFHWQDLLARFLPRLRVTTYYGAHRSLDDFAEKYDLILTSYGTLRGEKEVFKPFSFAVAIFDEVQAAKNHLSLTHKALKAIDATVRVGLTGTPIENNLLELKALLDLVLPGYLPTETVFKELFVRPIERQQDQERKQLLSRQIAPFILRRKKSAVLLELPEKVETLSYAPLSDEQKSLYQNVYETSRLPLLQELQDTSKPTPYIHVFALLTKLKQICDHPALYLNAAADYKKHASGKWDLFLQLLQETRASEQKLVVFSQYLGMLDIIESHLKEEGIGFSAIRGSTHNRKEQVVRFRDDPTCEVFVGSLQAAGVGIDLISASVVIHYDRWWNPAKENQATDRVHRMGQSRGVQVFKLVTRGTLEEALHTLIEKKLGLAEGILGYDDQAEFKTLSREDLIVLMQMLDGLGE